MSEPASNITPSLDLNSQINRLLEGRAASSQLRQRRIIQPLTSTHVEMDGRRLINFASNDYLGTAHHPALLNAIRNSLPAGAGSGAAGLITGYTPLHSHAESELAQWKQTEAAILLPSGYQANLAAIQTLSAIGQTTGVRFLVDKLAHASLIDAVRTSDAEFRVFPHNHLGKLERLLQQAPTNQMQVVVTESIFSMDGDAADLAGIARLKQKHPFILLLDEAHGSGVYGRDGAGYANDVGLADAVDVTIVTLSKALGLAGGAICASENFCRAVLNFGRAYIYSTSVTPVIASATIASLKVMKEEPGRQQRLRALARRVRESLNLTGSPIDSPIIPIILGEEAAALNASKMLEQHGFLVPAVRPPTVPKGQCRLRVTLCSDHSDVDIEKIVSLIKPLIP